MADANYPIPESPEYNPNIRALKDSDPAQASSTFNPLFQQIIENTAAVKKQADSTDKKMEESVDRGAAGIKMADGTSLEDAVGGLRENKADLDPQTHKVPESQLPKMDYAPTDHDHDGRYFTKEETLSEETMGMLGDISSPDGAFAALKLQVDGKSGAGHTHDDRYYTETEMDSKLSGKVGTSGDGSNTTVAFTEAASRVAPVAGETQATLWGKVKKLFADLKAVAFSGSYTDLSNVPSSFPPSDHNHSASQITSDILPLVRGGTGQSSLAGLVSQLSGQGLAQIATGSYVGTGTYGSSNPCRLTFPFVPKFFWIYATKNERGNLDPITHMADVFSSVFPWGEPSTDTGWDYATVAVYKDSTVSWYCNKGASYQCNTALIAYYFIALG